MHVILLGAAASGKSFSQSVLLQQLLPEALEHPISVEQISEEGAQILAQYQDYEDWTDRNLDTSCILDGTGKTTVEGDVWKLVHFLKIKFGMYGTKSCEEAGLQFPAKGVVVCSRDDSCMYLIRVKNLDCNFTKGMDFQHGLRVGNPVFFCSIDGEILRELETGRKGLDKNEKQRAKEMTGASSGFKKNMRTALQLLGFNTLQPSVHADLLGLQKIFQHINIFDGTITAHLYL